MAAAPGLMHNEASWKLAAGTNPHGTSRQSAWLETSASASARIKTGKEGALNEEKTPLLIINTIPL